MPSAKKRVFGNDTACKPEIKSLSGKNPQCPAPRRAADAERDGERPPLSGWLRSACRSKASRGGMGRKRGMLSHAPVAGEGIMALSHL